jgi:chemotaxis protein methyltransferase CheR
MKPKRDRAEPKLDPAEVRALYQLFREEAGLVFHQDMESFIERKLHTRMVALGFELFSQYVEFLISPEGRREIEMALDEVTTHETYFFREEFQLRVFRDQVLPRLRAASESRRRLNLWSAGCSTGEEAYTLSILLDDLDLEGWDVRVVGTDLSRRCIQQARRGVYGPASFRSTPREDLARFFVDDPDGARIHGPARDRCVFTQMNLLFPERSALVGLADAVFCRNVLIYLAEDARQRVLETLFDRMSPGGYLFLGHAESLLNVTSDFEAVHFHGDVVYRRPERGTFSRSRRPPV